MTHGMPGMGSLMKRHSEATYKKDACRQGPERFSGRAKHDRLHPDTKKSTLASEKEQDIISRYEVIPFFLFFGQAQHAILTLLALQDHGGAAPL
jgi:hypothetical protein